MKHRQKVPCSICGKVLKSIVALKNHEDKHIADSLPDSETKKFSCDVCGLRFRLKCYVFNHMNNVHLRNKYPCEFCGKGFYKKYEKMEHVVRMHTNERPITCEFEGCGKTFARQKNYNIHKVSSQKFFEDFCNFLYSKISKICKINILFKFPYSSREFIQMKGRSVVNIVKKLLFIS